MLLVNTSVRGDIWGPEMSQRCRALSLVVMPIIPPWPFTFLLFCSWAWSIDIPENLFSELWTTNCPSRTFQDAAHLDWACLSGEQEATENSWPCLLQKPRSHAAECINIQLEIPLSERSHKGKQQYFQFYSSRPISELRNVLGLLVEDYKIYIFLKRMSILQ